MTVSQDIRTFGETTSIRGIPRALKHTDKALVVVWWLAVVTCAAVLVTQLALILIRYYKYDYSTAFREGAAKPVRYTDMQGKKCIRTSFGVRLLH